MAAVPIQIDGVLYDLLNKSTQRVVLQGEASIIGLSVGGGPVIPPAQPGAPGAPTFPIWGPPGSNFPDKPGYPPVVGGGPIIPLPPDAAVPPPGSPPVIVGGTQPVQPIVPPGAVLIEYPGIGKVVVPQPVPSQDTAPAGATAPPR